MNFEAIVRQNDVNKILADVMHVTGNRGKHNTSLRTTRGPGLLHVRLQQRNGFFHNRGTLQNKWQLHLAGTEEITDHLHSN